MAPTMARNKASVMVRAEKASLSLRAQRIQALIIQYSSHMSMVRRMNIHPFSIWRKVPNPFPMPSMNPHVLAPTPPLCCRRLARTMKMGMISRRATTSQRSPWRVPMEATSSEKKEPKVFQLSKVNVVASSVTNTMSQARSITTVPRTLSAVIILFPSSSREECFTI